ncbi:MAG TPA: alkaline phosphatase family protein [Sinomonas sp.]|nr:alkaline phosphatase family protein [Sinomonas sp.]
MRSRIIRRLVAALAAVLGCLPLVAGAPGAATASNLPVPTFDHIFTILMENHSYSEIIGDTTDAPYIHSLATTYGLGSNTFAVGHPSLPNYLELTSGSNDGVTTDCNPSTCTVNAPNIAADRITPAGKTWKAYEESMPAPCTLSDSGEYAVRHNPFVYYSDIQTTSQCNNDVPYTQLSTDLGSATTTPNYSFITPNLIDDMHDGTIAQGDAWLSQNVPAILNSPAFKSQNSLLQIVWDEDDSSENNQVPTIYITSGMVNGTANKPYDSFEQYNHFSLLKTIESAWALAPLTGNDSGATPESDVFGAPSNYPSAPTAVTATAGRHGTATVNWTAPSSSGACPITGYGVATVPLNVGTVTVSGTSATISGLKRGTTYTFTVSANNCDGSSVLSNASNPVTP